MQHKSMVLAGLLAVLAMAFSACIQPLTPPADGGQEESAAMEVGPSLEGMPWQMVALADENGDPVEIVTDVEVTALFEGGKVSGTDGCNNYSGAYTVDGTSLTVGPEMMGTMMACPALSMDQATAYTAALTSAASYAIVDNQLRIKNDAGHVVVTFEERMATSLTGTTWNAIGYNNGKGGVVSIAIDTEITAVFAEDGTLSGSAGCNNYTAGYEADDEKIEISPAALTMMMCAEPEGLMEQETLYLAALGMANVYSIDGDRLQLRTSEGSLVADYRAAGEETEVAETGSSETEPAETESAGNEETTLYVGPTQADCVGAGPMTCMLVKTDPNEEYTLFYNQIEGFEYVPGYEYELLVNVEDVPNPPADGSSLKYTLVEEVDATEVGPSLEGTPWQMVALADETGASIEIVAETEVTALFEDGKVSGSDGCNSYSGSYTVDGTSLTVGPEMMGTMMACPDPITKQAMAYTTALTSAAGYAIVNNQLRILNDSGRVVVTYEERVATSLSGTTWNATGYNNGKGGVVSIAIDTEITAVFAEDGTLSGSAGCNNYTAGYEADNVADNGNIEISPAAVTMMMCAEPEGVMEQEALYLAALGTANVYSIDGDRLQLRTSEGSLVADYRAAGDDAAEADDGAESGTAQPVAQPAVAATPAGSDDLAQSLANMEYKSEYTANGTALLEDGKYSEEAAPGSASKVEVSLTEHVATGELNGQPAAAVALVTNPGGSGTFYDLAVVMEQDGKPVNVATTSLGDRVQINSITIEDNQIVVDMIQSGPTDPMCCPTQHVINRYALEGDKLVETSSDLAPMVDKPTGGAESEEKAPAADVAPVARDGIVGVEWHFFEFESGDGSQVFVDEPGLYTLLLNPDGTAAVKADCNNGSGSYQLDGSSLTIEIVAVTRALCSPDSHSDDYLRLLGDVMTYVENDDGEKDDVLALNLKMDAGNMLFQLEAATDEQVHQPTDLIPQNAISVEPGNLATSYHWQVLPPTPYDASMPPGPIGAPPHAVVTFDYFPAPKALLEGGPYVVVYPVDAYMKLWQDAGNETITKSVASLQTLLEEQPTTPVPPMPILPPPGAVNDLAVQNQTIDFADGSGVRFVGRLSQDASPVLNGQTDYYVQGLTEDGRFYVSMRWPVTTSSLPSSMEEITPEQQQAIESDFATYMQQTTDTLNGLESSDWTPNLTDLDALFSSVTVSIPESE